jgi:hypothetical protein
MAMLPCTSPLGTHRSPRLCRRIRTASQVTMSQSYASRLHSLCPTSAVLHPPPSLPPALGLVKPTGHHGRVKSLDYCTRPDLDMFQKLIGHALLKLLTCLSRLCFVNTALNALAPPWSHLQNESLSNLDSRIEDNNFLATLTKLRSTKLDLRSV